MICGSSTSRRWSVLIALSACSVHAAEVQTKKTDWCVITAPKSTKVGDTVQIRVKLTGLADNAFVFCDLKNQDHKMVKWGGGPRAAAKGKEVVFDLTVRDTPGTDAVYGFVGVQRRKEDQWPNVLAHTSSPLVKITGRSPLVDLTYKKSWIWVDASNGGKPLVSGDRWEVPVEYYLDPADHYQKTTLSIWGTGPWIDSPDGKYTKKRGHIGYPGLGRRLDLTEPGAGRHVFTFTVPKGLELVKKSNRVLLITGFRDASGKSWPWYVRANNSFVRRRGFFEIETDVPGHLFTYDEPVRISIRLKNVQQPGERKTVRYKVHDTRGVVVSEAQKEFVVERDGQKVAIDLGLERRGVFLIELDVPGWEKRHTTFARIPDLKAITKGRPTRFGLTTHWDAPPEEVWAVAQRLGLTTCRRFTQWYRLQPGPDVFKLDDIERELATARRYGVREWLCIVDAPAFAFPGKVERISYRAFDCKWDVWEHFVRTVTTRLKGKFLGWEWLNEITPGGCDDPVGTYVEMCRIGTEIAKSIDASLVTVLAGGLYPRTFRVDVLTAGVGQYIDALPVHYQNGDGIFEARQDLDAAGCKHVAVWEDESAKGLNTWGVPPLEELMNTLQCDWVLMQWTDELAAGCEKIIYFGGKGSAAGSFGYLLDDLSPRPVAATLAVFTSKMFRAKPLGLFLLGKGGLFHLFERDGKPILVASTYEEAGERIGLSLGSESVVITDYQGNETVLRTSEGRAELPLATTRCFVEGGDLDVLKAYVVPEIQVARVGSGTSANVARARRITPRVSLLRGREGKLIVRLRNLYGRELSGEIRLEGASESTGVSAGRKAFALAKGEVQDCHVSVTVASDIEAADHALKLAVTFDWAELPRIDKEAVLSIITPDLLGNLMPNGDFETPDAAGTGPEGFRVNGKTKMWANAEGLGEGLGQRVIKFQNCANWEYVSRTIPLRGGKTYLYTAWVRNQDMGCGSNMTQYLADGRRVRLYDTQVFRCGTSNPHWQVFTCRKLMPAGTERVSFTPVVKGSGWAMYDNLRVTLYEGSDYVAEAHRCATPPKIDGRLDEWVRKCPIPLIGKNQITSQANGYAWTPDNLSAIGYLMWDDTNLFVAFRVQDSLHHATGSGKQIGTEFTKGDSLILAMAPTKRGPDAASKSFAYYLSSTVPGGGSGKHTLFRPKAHAGGRPSGHLFRDSSVYDLAIQHRDSVCVYELRVPFTELGLQADLGAKVGLSVQLNDNDGHGPVAQMNWGGGLHPKWYARNFGIVTFVQ